MIITLLTIALGAMSYEYYQLTKRIHGTDYDIMESLTSEVNRLERENKILKLQVNELQR